MVKPLMIYKSPDNRYRTDYFTRDGVRFFCVAERIRKGTLITEFTESGMPVDQEYYRDAEQEEALERRVGSRLEIFEVKEYQKVIPSAECGKCRDGRIIREMDLTNPWLVEEIPVVPIFKCQGCGERFYAMSEEYLDALVERNLNLFDKGELEEKARDRWHFVNTLNEYIIRIFASKKISRLVVKE